MAVRGALSPYYDEIRLRAGVLPGDVPEHIADEFARESSFWHECEAVLSGDEGEGGGVKQ